MMKKTIIAAALLLTLMACFSAFGFDAGPTNWISGFTSDGTNMVIPIASLPYLDAGQCDASTGDVRQIVFAMQEAIYQKWLTIPATNRSTRINVSRASSVYSNRITYTFSYQADVVPVSLTLMPE